MKFAERIVLIAIPLIIVGGVFAIYYGIHENRATVNEAVQAGEYERPVAVETGEPEITDWRAIYPVTVPVVIGDAVVRASVADTLPTRIKGLSDTPYLPDNVVKLFVFGVPGEHAIWMKDMNYALDIIWADEGGKIVHIEERVAPETYPESFESSEPAWYVVEANAGFVASNTIAIGDHVILPTAAE